MKLQAFCILNLFYFCLGDVVIVKYGTYEDTYPFELDSTTMFVIKYPKINTKNPFRVVAWSTNAVEDFPVLVVVTLEKHVTAWQVPFIQETSRENVTMKYWNTSRVICHDYLVDVFPNLVGTKNPPTQSFTISLSTSSEIKVNIYIKVEEDVNFFMKNKTQMFVSPSQPGYLFYELEPVGSTSETTIIKVSSDHEICLIVSVQDTMCPFRDRSNNIMNKGRYQTINKKGSIIIKNEDFYPGFVLVFVAKADNYDCTEDNSYIPDKSNIALLTTNVTNLTVEVVRNISAEDFRNNVIFTLVLLGVFAIFAITASILFNKYGSISERNRRDEIDTEQNNDSTLLLVQQDPSNQNHSNTNIEETERTLQINQSSDPPLTELDEWELTVEKLEQEIKNSPGKNIKKKTFNFVHHLCSIALFYVIPAIQLVIIYQKEVNITGNQDLCYYNFECAHPAFGFSDFNHIFSNIGYVVAGFMFLYVVNQREKIIPCKYEKGIPVSYGIPYAMGIALIVEGILSASYHVCPTPKNFQFDTSFMYVMTALCMVKLYRNRHADYAATAHYTFRILGFVILFALSGIFYRTMSFVCYALYFILCVYISLKIYHLNKIKEGYEKPAFGNLMPRRKVRFISLIVANVINIFGLIAGITLYYYQIIDFPTILLGLLMINALLHTTYYIVMKIKLNGECICLEAKIYGVLSFAFWIAAIIFFANPATRWANTPAESREKNQDCIIFDFYDKHDIWHLLSAPALYFTFMFLLCLDDDIINKHRKYIKVF